jgi:prepilin-type N-terminal cleavage/methylation domain-containing protein
MLRNSIRKARTVRSVQEAREEGFTLIELLIVIVVLGILAGIVVFGVATFRADAETAACEADVKTVSVASDAFIARNGAPAATVAALVTAGYLKTAPATAVVYTAATGAVAPPAGGC